MKIAILGSGPVGAALAKGFLDNGHSVMRASRDPGKLEDWKTGAKGDASVGTFADATTWGDVAVLAVKGSVAEELVGSLAANLAGKLVIDATNPISDDKPVNGVISYFTKQNESLMERLQARVPAAKFVKAFNSVGNAFMVNPPFKPQATMFICGNDAGAKQTTTDILTKFGWHVVDLGAVEAARPIESLCMLWCIPGMSGKGWTHALRWMELEG
jgi:8-hydroxy-5-deazaflavin:NADPH oxidoreductase